MKANIKGLVDKTNNLDDFRFVKISGNVANLTVRSVLTDNYTKSTINVFDDDIGLSKRLSDLIGNIMTDVSKTDLNVNGLIDDTKAVINDTVDVDETKRKSVNISIAAHANVYMFEQISKSAMEQFNEIFGEGSIESIIVARYGRNLIPNLLFILKLICYISEFSAIFSTATLSKSIAEIKERVKNV